MDIRRESKPDKGDWTEKKRISEQDKKVMFDYYQAVRQMNKNSREDLLEELSNKYGRSTRQIERYLTEMGEKHDVAVESVKKQHFEDLNATLQKLLVNLKLAKKYEFLKEEIIGEIDLNKPDLDQLKSFDPILAGSLLLHIQAELPELRDLKNWGRLKVGGITDALLEKLSIIAYRHTFEGTCPGC